MLPTISLPKQSSLNHTEALGNKYYDFYTFKLTRRLKLQLQSKSHASNLHYTLDSQKDLAVIRSKCQLPRKNTRPANRKSNSYVIRKCCAGDGVKVSENQVRRNRVRLAQHQLFKQIKEDDREILRDANSFDNITLRACNSILAKGGAKWGSNNAIKLNRQQVHGRSVRGKKPLEVKERSRESLERLASGDVKLYIPSRQDYVKVHARAIVRELLLQSNSGVKYRNLNKLL